MSSQTPVYLYYQRQLVVLLEATANATRRYEKVYAKELTINRGVDNQIQFQFINQEQKPVNILNKEITCRILNYNGTKVLLQKSLTPLLPITGITSLQLSSEDIENITEQQCFYSLEIPVGNFDYPVFVDSNGGARGVLRIVNSVLPSFVQAEVVSIPSHPTPKAGDSKTYYSSYITTDESPILTSQVFFDNFTGSIQFQGSTVPDFSTFYDLTEVDNYVAYTGNIGITIVGYHPYMRCKIVNIGTLPASPGGDLLGDISQILAR